MKKNAPKHGKEIKRVVVLGDGSWGTALARLLAENGVHTVLWSAFPEQAEAIRADRENKKYLPGVALPESLEVNADPFAAAEGADLALSVVPTQFLRKVASGFEDALGGDVPIASAEVQAFAESE